jgi:hypothetical protein
MVSLSLIGCLGPMSSLHWVQGEAPVGGGCDVVVTKTGTTEVIAKESVRGNFSVTYSASGPIAPRVDISAQCNGATIKELKAVSPRSTESAQLGKLAP